MSDPKPPSAPDSTAYHPSSGEPPPPAVAHGEAIFPDGAQSSDDAPTIISKKSPRRGGTGSSNEGIVSGSLRGRTLAHFELIEPIGVGGMAAVIRARDRQLDRPVALKILPPEMAGDPENVARFHQEARAAAKLDHENIARVFFCGEDQRLHFIAFEFVEGVNLRTLLERRGRLPVREAVHYMLQIATGLAHAAARGVVHRDIKPSNIIISPNGRAKLVDMGLARNMGPQSEQDLTQSGVTLGTFDYIAPEQAMDPREADVRSDIYSLGCTFYHMVTGQPPVPEGTAAKKLHYHQQVAPVDPRQLNPSIPDDVAAILRRMMAKDPKDRYQRAEHLVQHLIQVAQKLGAIADVPDGVLFVDAPLPAPPARRPLLMAAAAVFLLGVLLIVLSLAPGKSGSPRPFRPTADAGAPRAVQRDQPAPQDKKPEKPPDAQGPLVVKSARDLREVAAKPAAAAVKLHGEIPINESIRFPGGSEQPRVVESAPGERAVLRIVSGHGEARADGWGGLEIDGGSVTFRNLTFEVDAKTATDSLLAGVLVRRGGRVRFEGCTFRQPRVSMQALLGKPDVVPIASVAVWNDGRARAERPDVSLSECYFEGGQAAVSVLGSAAVRTTNCAFGPHVTLFHLRGGENPSQPPSLDLRYVSALLVYGPAFRLDRGVACEISATESIFSRVGTADLRHDPPNLIQETGSDPATARFTGLHNCYHGLNYLWVRGPAEGEKDANLEDFRLTLRTHKGSDRDSLALPPDEGPWESLDPLELARTNPQTAFAVKPKMAALRRAYDPLLPIGVAKCAWGFMPKLPPLPPTPVAARKPNEKIVDPLAEKSTGVYRTLSAAIQDANDDDIILIRHTGPLEISPAKLKVAQRLTIRPEGAHRPVLTIAAKTVDSEALFTLYHGQLRFEGLDFLLKPDLKPERSDTGRPVAVAALKGNGQVVFKKCVLTLEQPEGGAAPLCVVALSENRGAMEMAPPDMKGVPEITLEKCLIRGDGDLLAVRGSRPFVLEVDGSLAVLHGSLVNVEGLKPQDNSGTAKVALNATTTYLQDHLVSLRARSGKSLVYTDVQAENCVFAAAGGRPLVRIEGPDTEDQMRRVFAWHGKGNTYSGYDKLLEQPAAEGGVPIRYDQDRWKTFANETDPEPRFVQLKFAVPDSEAAFRQAVPPQFRIKATPGLEVNGGAPLQQLPAPAAVEPAPADGPLSSERRGEESESGME
jgi:hypothetical protein